MKLRKIFQLSKFMRYGLLIFLILILFSFIAAAQEPRQNGGANGQEGSAQAIKPLVVGQKMPEEFWTREHLFYHNGDTIRKSLTEYKGKMLILDFWNTKCASCIAHQEEIDHFKAHFPAEIQVLMVNPSQGQDNYKLIDDFYKLHQQKAFAKSGLTSIILDEDLRQIFPSCGFPHYVWLNKYGYYQLSTYRNLLSRKYFSPFID